MRTEDALVNHLVSICILSTAPMIQVVVGGSVPRSMGAGSVVRGVVVSLPTLGVSRAQMNLGYFCVLSLYYYVHIRLHCGSSTSNSLS